MSGDFSGMEYAAQDSEGHIAGPRLAQVNLAVGRNPVWTVACPGEVNSVPLGPGPLSIYVSLLE